MSKYLFRNINYKYNLTYSKQMLDTTHPLERTHSYLSFVLQDGNTMQY